MFAILPVTVPWLISHSPTSHVAWLPPSTGREPRRRPGTAGRFPPRSCRPSRALIRRGRTASPARSHSSEPGQHPRGCDGEGTACVSCKPRPRAMSGASSSHARRFSRSRTRLPPWFVDQRQKAWRGSPFGPDADQHRGLFRASSKRELRELARIARPPRTLAHPCYARAQSAKTRIGS